MKAKPDPLSGEELAAVISSYGLDLDPEREGLSLAMQRLLSTLAAVIEAGDSVRDWAEEPHKDENCEGCTALSEWENLVDPLRDAFTQSGEGET